jgi:hypothetical protein
MKRRGLAAILLVAATVGCNDDGAITDEVIAVNGHPFAKKATGAGQVFSNDDVSIPKGYVVELYSNASAGCLQFMSNGRLGAELQLHFPVQAVGTFDVNPGNTVFIVDGDPQAAIAKSGSIAVVSVDEKHLVGTYDVTFQTGERLAGGFDAPLCN